MFQTKYFRLDLDTLVREKNLDLVTLKMMKMYQSDEYKNSIQSIKDLVTIKEIVKVGGIEEAFVWWLMEENEVYYILDVGVCYFNFGEVVDKHNWYQWVKENSESLGYKVEKLNVVSKILGVAKGKIKDMVNNGEISFELVDGIYYVDEDEVKSKMNTSSENNNSQFDNTFHLYLKEISKRFVKYYSHNKDEYYLRKSELCKEVLAGDESNFTLAFLYDFVQFQFAHCMREIQKGNTKNNDMLENQKMFSYLLEVLKETPKDANVINTNPQNDYSY